MNIRNQIADTLKYLRKTEDWTVLRREYVDQGFGVAFNLEHATLADLVYCANENLVPLEDITFELHEGEDYDGFLESHLSLKYPRLMTDEEYFNSLCYLLLPTEYQISQWEQYQKLKTIFEGE